MFHRVRRKMHYVIIGAILLVVYYPPIVFTKSIDTTEGVNIDDDLDNNIIDFDDEYSVKFDKKYGLTPWQSKAAHRYTIVNDNNNQNNELSKSNITNDNNNTKNGNATELHESTTTEGSIPVELQSTTENYVVSIIESTTEPDITVIPISKIQNTVNENPDKLNLPTSTENIDTSSGTTTDTAESTIEYEEFTTEIKNSPTTTPKSYLKETSNNRTSKDYKFNVTSEKANSTKLTLISELESSELNDKDVPLFTELDAEDQSEVPEDYYDAKDIVPTPAPQTDALSVLVGLAGSVVESVAERVVPRGIFDLFKRMQKQSEALEAERLRSREENGGIGQFGRGLLKSISSGIGRPLSQLMAGDKDKGSLDSDKGFVGNLASSVTSVANVANSVVDAFKDRVQAIYPGTVWCGDGRSATARSGDLGLFFFTDTCCRQHDACKIYIKAGETKYGLTNTGLFTRSHCSCDAKFKECLRKTNSLVSAQIGLTYFNVLGPQCFRRSHPIVKCVRRTRLTGQKCEKYELDYTKSKMWQWFDNETF